MDFGKAFMFMFEDPEWLKKLGIGTLVGLVGILLAPVLIGIIPLIVLIGYTVDVVRNVMNGSERQLPEWDDWGGFLSRGLKVFGATLVWALPIILLMIPLAIGSAIADEGSGAEGLGMLIIVCGSCLVLIWSLFLTLITPAIYIRIAATDRFASAFEFSEMLAFTRQNLGNVIISLLLLIVVGLIASAIAFVGVLALVVGLLITIPFSMLWQYLVQAHLFGQIARNSVAPVA